MIRERAVKARPAVKMTGALFCRGIGGVWSSATVGEFGDERDEGVEGDEGTAFGKGSLGWGGSSSSSRLSIMDF